MILRKFLMPSQIKIYIIKHSRFVINRKWTDDVVSWCFFTALDKHTNLLQNRCIIWTRHVQAGNSDRRERFSTVDLLVLTSSDQLLAHWKHFYSFTEQAILTRRSTVLSIPSPSVRIPWYRPKETYLLSQLRLLVVREQLCKDVVGSGQALESIL